MPLLFVVLQGAPVNVNEEAVIDSWGDSLGMVVGRWFLVAKSSYETTAAG